MSKRSLEPQEDDIKVNGKPIRALHVFHLKWELKWWNLPTNGKKQELVDRLNNHLKNLPSFDTLPEEVVLKIMKMVIADGISRNELIKFSEVSPRIHRFRFVCTLKQANLVTVMDARRFPSQIKRANCKRQHRKTSLKPSPDLGSMNSTSPDHGKRTSIFYQRWRYIIGLELSTDIDHTPLYENAYEIHERRTRYVLSDH